MLQHETFNLQLGEIEADNMNSSSTDHPLRTASPPFDKQSADVILRTSDTVEFYVRKAILEEASMVFADIFSMHQAQRKLDTVYEQHNYTSFDQTTLEHSGTTANRPSIPLAEPLILCRSAGCG